MKISDSSSDRVDAQPTGGNRRKSFALTGPSVSVDARTYAVRGDLADVRLADQVFAPHYAAPLPMTIKHACHLFEEPSKSSESLALLDSGTCFEVLDFSGKTAWGIAQPAGLVGYVDKDALEIAPKAG